VISNVTAEGALLTNKYTRIYLKYIYFISVTHLHIYDLNMNILKLYFWYTNNILKVF